MDETDLIRTVRGLDQSGPGADGEILQQLWKCLVASSNGQFHAAEESCLRWLLKSMNGTSESAETLRRYPLTWTILDCVFQRIPLFSLAKSLADRRFMVVLQQTLKDISNPTTNAASSGSSKRKRSPGSKYDLEHLKDQESCIQTCQTLFCTLRSLLSQLNDKASNSSRDEIGAEHIKSLFCTSAADATAVTSPSLTFCQLLLASDACDEITGRETWIDTISTIWDLHLQGSDDTLEVATHLFRSSVLLLSKLEDFSQSGKVHARDSWKAKWSSDLQKFMHRNFITPARAAFTNRQDFEPVTKAIEASKTDSEVSAPALYFLASGASDRLRERDMRRTNALWMKQIFQAVELMIRERPDRNTLMKQILAEAARRSAPVDIDDLRAVCREYAMKGEHTDWSLVAKVATCEPDVFQTSEKGSELLKEICKRSIASDVHDGDFEAISEIIGAIKKGFRTHRDFTAFLKLWYEQLCTIEKQKLDGSSPWLKVGREGSLNESFENLIEMEMSAQQVLDVVEWVMTQESQAHPRAVSLFADAVAQGVRSEPFIDAIGRKLLDLVLPVKTTSDATALKWRVVSKTLSSVVATERTEAWSEVQSQLSKLLKKAPIKSAEAFEAFKCCCQIWDSMNPDDERVNEPAEIIEKFTARFAEEISSSDVLNTEPSSPFQLDTKSEFREDSAYQQYLAWQLLGPSRFVRLNSNRKDGMPLAIRNAIATENATTDGLRSVWQALLSNDISLNDTKVATDLIDRVVSSLEESEKEKGWPGERGQMWIHTLSGIPSDAFSRPQRERVMMFLDKRRSKMLKSPKEVSQEGWKLVLDLGTKMMSRPTFYEGMRFADLVEIADAMSSLSFEASTSDEALSELIERFFAMSSATIRQMADNIDNRSVKYFDGATKFVSGCGEQAAAGEPKSRKLPSFHITLLKALVTELSRSTTSQNHEELVTLPQNGRKVLAKCIMVVIDDFIADKKLLTSRDVSTDLNLFAAVDAAFVVDDFTSLSEHKSSAIKKLEKRSKEAMQKGDPRGWKIQGFLQTYFSTELEDARPTTFNSLDNLPSKLRERLLKEHVLSITKNMDTPGKVQYLRDLIKEYTGECDVDGQILAINFVVNQLIELSDSNDKVDALCLAEAHSELTPTLLRKSPNASQTCRILHTLLEKKPQSMTQWNIEITLSTICTLSSPEAASSTTTPFLWLCKLAEIIIKKHRLRLEGHYHLLLTTIQSLLRNLVVNQTESDSNSSLTQDAKAQLYARLITLICEPTAGAVSRSHHQGALDSATDAAKRSAGRHMYMVLMLYVKLQLEANVPGVVSEALEPAMNSIFDITPPEGRKILNDAMDASGRAILREMFKRYVKFGKWQGV